MKKLALGISLGALALAGTAYAHQHMRHDDDGVMTRTEAQAKATEMFAHMDANKDGKLDDADRDARMARKFDAMDSDRNGQLSRAEFMAAHQGPMAGRPGHDGHAGHGQGNHGHHGHHGGMMKMMAKKADTNKDGAVSQAEFAAAAMARFDKADADHNDQVTAEERRTAHAAMRESWRAERAAPAPAASSATTH